MDCDRQPNRLNQGLLSPGAVRTGSGAGIDYCAVRRNTAQATLDGEDDAEGNRNDDRGAGVAEAATDAKSPAGSS
jgi:hypothetical protein